jgi:hypothetical protein
MHRALSGRSPSLRASLRRSVGPESWLRRNPTACLIRRPLPSVSGRCLRGSARSNLMSSPFYRPEALSCAMPMSVPHRLGITYQRGCGLRPSTILKWLEILLCFRRQCLLLESQRLGAHLTRSSMWQLCDVDINTLATIIPSIEILGPITRSRAQQ